MASAYGSSAALGNLVRVFLFSFRILFRMYLCFNCALLCTLVADRDHLGLARRATRVIAEVTTGFRSTTPAAVDFCLPFFAGARRGAGTKDDIT